MMLDQHPDPLYVINSLYGPQHERSVPLPTSGPCDKAALHLLPWSSQRPDSRIGMRVLRDVTSRTSPQSAMREHSGARASSTLALAPHPSYD